MTLAGVTSTPTAMATPQGVAIVTFGGKVKTLRQFLALFAVPFFLRLLWASVPGSVRSAWLWVVGI